MSRNRARLGPRTYYLRINSLLSIIHKSRGYGMPSWFDELSFSVGKKTYEGYQIGDRVRMEDVPGDVLERVRLSRVDKGD